MKIILSFIAYLLFESSVYTMEAADQHQSKTQYTQPAGYCSRFLCERLSGLYYTFSVVGHFSQPAPVAEFLKRNFSRAGWTLVEEEYSKNDLPSSSHADFKTYADIRKKREEYYNILLPVDAKIAAEDYELVKHSTTYQYLWKESNDGVSVILCGGGSQINFAHRDRRFKVTYDQLRHMQDEVTSRQATPEQKDIQELSHAPQDANDESGFIFDDESMHMLSREYTDGIDISMGGFHSQFLGNLLQNLKTKFATKIIKIHTFLASEEEVSNSYINRLINFLNRSTDPYIGHYCYGKVVIYPNQSKLDVSIIDPNFNVERPIVRSICGSPNPLPLQSAHFFMHLGSAMGWDVNHTYHYRGDQVVNFNDCGRFSMIYLFAEINGQSALSLSNYDIYRGFKMLYEYHYDLFHQRITSPFMQLERPSLISKYGSGALRLTCDAVLRTFFSLSRDGSQSSKYSLEDFNNDYSEPVLLYDPILRNG